MQYGVAVRMRRILPPVAGRSIVFALDDGIYEAPTGALLRSADLVAMLSTEMGPHLTVLANIGFLERFVPSDVCCGRIASLTLSSPHALSAKVPVNSVEAAIRSGADAVAVHLSTDGESEAETVSAASRIADAARQMGLPVLVAAYSRPRESISPDHVRAVRVAVEIGADIIKSADPGRVDVLEQMCQVVGSAPILLASGGPLADAGASEIVHRLASAPRSVGLCFGRAVTASSEPRRVVRLLRDVQQGGMY